MKVKTTFLTACLVLTIAVYSSAHPPKIKSFFAGKQSGDITKEELLSDSVVLRGDENSPRTTDQSRVTSFKVSVIRKGGDPILDIPIDGNKMPQKIKDLIMTLHAGDILVINSVLTGLYGMSDANKNGASIPHKVPVGSGDPILFKVVDK